MKIGKSVKSAGTGLIEKLNRVVNKIVAKILNCNEPFFLIEIDTNSGYFIIYKIGLFSYLFNFRKTVSLQTKFSFKCLVWVHKEIYLFSDKTGQSIVKEIITKQNWESVFNSLSINK